MMILKAILLTTVLVPAQVDEPTDTTAPETTTTTVPAQTTSSQQTAVDEPAEEQSTAVTATYVSEPPQEGPYEGLY